MARLSINKYKRKGGFIMRHEEILTSNAYRDLSPVAKCLMEEFQRIYRPGRNGELSISIMRAKELLRVHKDTAGKAFYELAEHGFIVLKKGSYWRARMAREWGLTFEPINNHEPTDDWKTWESGKPVLKLSHKPRYQKLKSQNKVQDSPMKCDSLSSIMGQTSKKDAFYYDVLTRIQ